ncbi:FAD-dependent oxidoreductase [Fodinicola feengrottensis]|uniref:Flavin-dependent monooxygenase n=1 Tax=Fodinicola feengrottensis TaxID=435914 RepID=A0ABN2FSG2_9ACTN|nr:NAD(P)/FAD-dependent oxidoreductase [Fodinicola feengrottensis]
MRTTDKPRIAIVGGGLGGLACARVLQLHGHSATVFEYEETLGARSQGGTLDMHEGTGQVALWAAGLFDEFTALARPEGQEWRRIDHLSGLVVQDNQPEDGPESRPEIDRGQLRGILLNSLTAGTVRWNAQVTAVTTLGDGTWQLVFAHGSSETFDLVVGADGAWSRVRAALTGAEPLYTGVSFIEVGFDDADRRHAELARLTGNGTMIAKAPGLSFFVQRNSNAHLRAYIAMRTPENWHQAVGLDFADTAAVRAHLLTIFAGWHDNLLDVLRNNDGGFIHRPLYKLPVPHVWEHTPGLTLLGDAAHLMPPLGLGANLAMLDGVELAAAVDTESSLDEAVRTYESIMLPRSTDAAKRTGEGLDHLMPPVTA